jgi:hypothetical protein
MGPGFESQRDHKDRNKYIRPITCSKDKARKYEDINLEIGLKARKSKDFAGFLALNGRVSNRRKGQQKVHRFRYQSGYQKKSGYLN